MPEANIGTSFGAKKLNGELFESENEDKINLFPSYAGEEKNNMSYPQAARWLVALNNYDDTAGKKIAKNRPLPSMGPGWLGRIGVVYVKGGNLFETLMRNLMFLKDGAKPWEPDVPCWELDDARSGERTEVSCPDNFAALMTMQFRRILLEREEDRVVRYTVLGGDFFNSTNAFAEPMTLWNKKEYKKTGLVSYYPRKHDMTKQLWREFSALSGMSGHKPGVIWWNTYLQSQKILLKKEPLQICAVGVEYGKQSASMKDYYTDELSMELELLNGLGCKWQNRVDAEVQNCEQAAKIVGHLAQNLAIAAGNLALAAGDKKGAAAKSAAGDKKDAAAKSAAQSKFYFRIDQPFRRWLQSINPETDDLEEKMAQWQEQAHRIAKELGGQMVEQAGTAAFVGRRLTDRNNKEKSYLYTAPKAYNSFLYELRKLYPKMDEGGTT